MAKGTDRRNNGGDIVQQSASPAAAAAQIVPDCRLLIAAGDKGSTGKSTMMGCIVEWVRERAPLLPMAVFDPDPQHRTLTKLFGPEGTSPLQAPHRFESVNFEGRDGMPLIDDIVRAFAPGPHAVRLSLVDGVANKFDDTMVKWARDVELYELTQEYGFRVTFMLMMNEVGSTVEQARRLVDEMGDRADYLVVRNCKVTNSLVWDTAGAAELRAKVLEQFKGCQVTLEGFSWDQVKLVDGQADAKLYTVRALADAEGPADSFSRNRSKSTWRRIVQQLDSAARVILPPNETEGTQ